MVPYNLTNKFPSLDIIINQKAKKFVSNQFSKWYIERVSHQVTNWNLPDDVKVSLKLRDLKSLYAKMDGQNV